MELTTLKKFTDRVVTVDLELLAARESHSEAIADLKLEMKKNQHMSPTEIKAVMKAAKIEITPLEKLAATKEVDTLAEEIVATKRPNADQKPLS